MNKPYILKHPLYPHPKALEHIKKITKGNLSYKPHAGAFDTRYNQWYEACRIDIDEGLAEDRELYHYVTSIYRNRHIDGEKIYYKEYIVGKDKDQLSHTFDHYEGMFEVLQVDRFFNYSTGKPDQRYTGNTDKFYYIDYSPEKILELVDLAPTGKHQNYYVIGQGGKKLTHDVFFTPQTFAYMEFDELYEIATAPLLSESIRSKIRTVQKEYPLLKNKTSGKQ